MVQYTTQPAQSPDSKLMNAAMKSQQSTNEKNLRSMMAKKWIVDPLDPATNIRLVRASDTDQQADINIAEIGLNPYILTEYELHVTRMKAWYYVY